MRSSRKSRLRLKKVFRRLPAKSVDCLLTARSVILLLRRRRRLRSDFFSLHGAGEIEFEQLVLEERGHPQSIVGEKDIERERERE